MLKKNNLVISALFVANCRHRLPVSVGMFVFSLIIPWGVSCGKKETSSLPVLRGALNDELSLQDLETPAYRSQAFLPATRMEKPLPIEWVKATRDEVYTDLAATWNNPTYEDEDSPLTKRLQYWADSLYDELSLREAERFKHESWNIPRPLIRIMDHPSRNALVIGQSITFFGEAMSGGISTP